MRYRATVVPDLQLPDEVAEVLRGLPEWFGIESSVRGYIEAARTLPTTFAFLDDETVGVCMIRRHNAVAAEIEVLAVPRAWHRHGFGRQLVEHVQADLVADGVKLLQVKTFGPSGHSEEYARTRVFYESLGFLPLEERTDIWGPENPCLIMVKSLV
jgi:ribosomal protein S18 acetylase RimI-like enzyme